MKPTKNRVFCPDCGKVKMLFETEKQAEGFIKFNGTEIIDDPSKLRVYFCPSCAGYHITHTTHTTKYDVSTDKMIKNYHISKFIEKAKKKDLDAARDLIEYIYENKITKNQLFFNTAEKIKETIKLSFKEQDYNIAETKVDNFLEYVWGIIRKDRIQIIERNNKLRDTMISNKLEIFKSGIPDDYYKNNLGEEINCLDSIKIPYSIWTQGEEVIQDYIKNNDLNIDEKELCLNQILNEVKRRVNILAMIFYCHRFEFIPADILADKNVEKLETYLNGCKIKELKLIRKEIFNARKEFRKEIQKLYLKK